MNLGALLTNILAGLKNELIILAAPDLITFLGNTSKLDPTSVAGQLGYVSQLDLLRSSLGASLVAAGPAQIIAINTAISNELQAVLQAALTKAQTPTAAVAK